MTSPTVCRFIRVGKRAQRRWFFRFIACVFIATALPGCVRRSIRITSEPSSAIVHLNDRELGPTAVSTDFLWYGDYDVVIRKEGYETLKTNWRLTRPWYQFVPIDFFAEVLWPGEFHDVHVRHFVLSEKTEPAQEELIERAQSLRTKALSGE